MAKNLSKFMQDNKFTLEDLRGGLVVLENLSYDYIWKGGIVIDRKKSRDTTKTKTIVNLEETCST